MPRARFIRPEFFTDEKVGELPYGARLLFAGIWCHSDLNGVFEYSAKQLRVLLFPFDEGLASSTVQEWLDELLAKGMVGRFESDGKTWGHVVNWETHQSISTKEKQIGTKRPDPPTLGHVRDIPGSCPGHVRVSPPTPSPATSPAVAVAPTRGMPGACPTPPQPISRERREQNREALAKAIRKQGLPASRDSVQEWADLLTGAGGCTDLVDALLAFRWIMGQSANPPITYAKHARPLALRWKAEVVDKSESA